MILPDLITHNPKVAGSNPAPATKISKILNGFRYEFGGHFYVWKQLRQILGKEFPCQEVHQVLQLCEHRLAISAKAGLASAKQSWGMLDGMLGSCCFKLLILRRLSCDTNPIVFGRFRLPRPGYTIIILCTTDVLVENCLWLPQYLMGQV
jgi:hypothetical protein